MKKKCTQCKEDKDLSEFFRSKFGARGRRAECKVCTKKYEGTQTHRYNKYSAQLMHYYGIDLEDWARMYNSQNGRCAVDLEHRLGFDRFTQVDHDHKTGKVRGLICAHCNRALGGVRDQINVLKKLIQYLDR